MNKREKDKAVVTDICNNKIRLFSLIHSQNLVDFHESDVKNAVFSDYSLLFRGLAINYVEHSHNICCKYADRSAKKGGPVYLLQHATCNTAYVPQCRRGREHSLDGVPREQFSQIDSNSSHTCRFQTIFSDVFHAVTFLSSNLTFSHITWDGVWLS